MGSYAKATMTGFICRLCSEPKKCVIHLYSAKAQKLELLKKLTMVLQPTIVVEKYDDLPKTVCPDCIMKLDLQYQLAQRVRKNLIIQEKHRLLHTNGRCPVECPFRSRNVSGNTSHSSENIDNATSN